MKTTIRFCRSQTGRRLGFLLLAFGLLVAGIESLRVLVEWWQAGRPSPGWREALAFAVLAVVAVAWWRHSVFSCPRGESCLLPGDEDNRG